jgi:hypothetical protein
MPVRKRIFSETRSFVPHSAWMLFQAVLPTVSQTCPGLDTMDAAEEDRARGEFKKEGAETLEHGTVAGNIGIPVAGVLNRLRRIGYGAG